MEGDPVGLSVGLVVASLEGENVGIVVDGDIVGNEVVGDIVGNEVVPEGEDGGVGGGVG